MLSEEQKESIEQLKSWRKYIIKNKEKVNKAKDLEFYIRTVLNLITKLQKENETKIKGFENEELSCSKFTEKVGKNIIDYKFEYENNQKIIDELQKENKEKDKQIDLMAEFMYKTGTGRRAFLCMFEQNDECNENGCKYCIKLYFKKLAKEKGEQNARNKI